MHGGPTFAARAVLRPRQSVAQKSVIDMGWFRISLRPAVTITG